MKRDIMFRFWDGKIMHYPDNNYAYQLVWARASGWELWWVWGDTRKQIWGEYLPPEFPSMQFTGLKDKNNKLIYEGDIVKWDDGSNGRYWRVCEIIWNKSRFELIGFSFESKTPEIKWHVDFKFGQFIYEYDGALEVIGNIYENFGLINNPQT